VATVEAPVKTAQRGVKVTTGQSTTIVVRMASVELLIGGPYTMKGERHSYGHVALRVTTTQHDRVFDYGRYGRVWGMGESQGEGMLRVWSDFNAYIAGESSYGRVTTGFVYETSEEQANSVLAHFDQKISGKRPTPKSRTGMNEYRIEDYDALGPNCTTMSVEAARIALPTVDSQRAKFQQGRGLSTMEKALVGVKGWPAHLVMPADLQAMLETREPLKPKLVRTFGAQ
jgi:hypothetical protein